TETGYVTESSVPYRGNVQSPYAILHVSFGSEERVQIVIPHGEQNAATGLDFVEAGNGERVPFGQLFNAAPPQELNPHRLDNTLVGIGVVYGGPGDDVIQGDHAIGGPGRDTLIGTAGDDELIGALPFTNDLGGRATLGTLWDEGGVFRAG